MKQVTWRFYGGIDTIGGNIIAVECENHRLLFDMGRLFNPAVPVFDHRIHARGIEDLQKAGIAPSIPGLFNDGTSGPKHMKTMVAISHSHLDHTGLLPYLRTNIPVLLSRDTYRLLQALDRVADGPHVPLSYQPIDTDTPVSFGPFTITLFAVDHGTPGACAISIDTPEGRLMYTGDLRLHGPHPELTKTFMDKAHTLHPHVLWVEGTRALPEETPALTNAELEERIIKTVCNQKAGVYMCYYNRDPERLDAFVKAAAQSERMLVLHAASAYIYKQFGGDLHNTAIYGSMAARAAWSDQAKLWIEEYGLSVIAPADIRNNEHRYLVEMEYSHFTDLFDIEPKAGGLYIHSNGSPLGPFDPSWNNMLKWMSIVGLEFVYLGTTGHASREDLLSIIETIQPDVVMPIHSFHPKRIGVPSVKRLMPEYNRTYTFADLELAKYPTLEDIEG